MPDPTRNYYRVLEVSPSASREDIRKAYRRMAMRFHPDRHPNIPPSVFAAIQEAYALLSDPAKRAEYDYQQYLYTGSVEDQPVYAASPGEVLAGWQQLKQEWKNPDPFRLDRNLLYFRLRDFLSPNNKQLLRQLHPKDPALHECIQGLLHLSSFLEKGAYWYITKDMQEWVADQPVLLSIIVSHQRSAKASFFWERNKTWVALGITILFCLLLFLYGRQ